MPIYHLFDYDNMQPYYQYFKPKTLEYRSRYYYHFGDSQSQSEAYQKAKDSKRIVGSPKDGIKNHKRSF